jgi:hypothetical protein
MEASLGTPYGPATEPEPAATEDATPASTVTLRVITHLVGSFDPSEPGVPVLTSEGTEVPAAEADRLIQKAADHGVIVEKVD